MLCLEGAATGFWKKNSAALSLRVPFLCWGTYFTMKRCMTDNLGRKASTTTLIFSRHSLVDHFLAVQVSKKNKYNLLEG